MIITRLFFRLTVPEGWDRALTEAEVSGAKVAIHNATFAVNKILLPYLGFLSTYKFKKKINFLNEILTDPEVEDEERNEILSVFLASWTQDEVFCLNEILTWKDFGALKILLRFEGDPTQVAI